MGSIEVIDRTTTLPVAQAVMSALADETVVSALSILTSLLIHIAKQATVDKTAVLAVIDASWNSWKAS